MILLTSLLFNLVFNASAQTPVTTHKYNPHRTGVNSTEKILNPTTVASPKFGKLFELPVKGEIYAQPLYVPKLKLADGSVRNVVFVAAMDNSLYAFDADQAPTKEKPYIWRTSIAAKTPPHEAPIPWEGILSTPAIDLEEGVIFVNGIVHGREHKPMFRLAKIALKDGSILKSVTVEGSLPGTGVDAIKIKGESRVPFNPEMHLQRPALLLHEGYVHLAFASHGDEGPFHGWIFSYRQKDLTGGPSFLTTPHGQTDMIGAGIWQSGHGLTVDDQGFVYATTGNGDFSPELGNWGNTTLKLKFSPEVGKFTALDFFTPHNHQQLNALDLDFGSAGVHFVPPRYLIVAGKSGKFYVLNRDKLGGFTKVGTGDEGAIQVLQVTEPAYFKIVNNEFMWNIHGAPVYWNNQVYVMGESDPVKTFGMDLATGLLTPKPLSKSTFAGPVGMPGGFITISSNQKDPAATGVLWVVHHLEGSAVWDYRPGRLYALDPHDLSKILWSSDDEPADQLGTFAKFVPPVVADGKVFQSTFSEKVVVYGLKP